MDITQSAEATQWINQFVGGHKIIAKSFINNLTLVSTNKLKYSITKSIIDIYNKYNTKIAIFPLAKSTKRREKEKRKHYGSEDAIGYILTGIEREHPREFIVSPTVESLRAEKIKCIVLVDDILGSGKRLVNNWLNSITTDENKQKTIRSWISYLKIDVTVVVYAIHSKGIEYIRNNEKLIKPIKQINIFSSLSIGSQPKWWNSSYEELCSIYGQETNKPKAYLGYGESKCTLVFEHSCPNNCPAILWATGKRWDALFPNRSVPISLHEYFENPQKNSDLELLFNSGNEQLAINLINYCEQRFHDNNLLNILILLGLLRRKIKINNLSKYTTFNTHEIKEILSKCINAKILTKDFNFTPIGLEILSKYKKNIQPAPKNMIGVSEHEIYIPSQFMGMPAKI